MNAFIDSILKKHLSPSIQLDSVQPLSGGCINNAFKVFSDQGTFFIKCNQSSLIKMFSTEERCLAMLFKHSPIRTPRPLGIGVANEKSYLLTEWIEKGAQSGKFWESFGSNLAIQHRETHNEFGLDHANFIGSLPQSNSPHTNWHSFFIYERLIPQLNLGISKNIISNDLRSQFDLLFLKLEHLIPKERPSLLHGDLWSGNFTVDQSGEAAIFDPAVYYGHRETELAFTQLFGGFSPSFYHAYQESFPVESGFDERIEIHNLYPLLVHVNLFGASYLSGVLQTLKRFS
ncbi:MAG: fructosamine kinase family protein [Ekhidna sp.]